MTEQKNTNSNKLSTFSIILIVIAFLFIVFAFFAPYLLTEYSWLTLNDDSPLGDTLGGIMNPFIAIGAAILTFLAFYMQFKANKQQREQFTQQLKEDKRQFSEELEEQRKQFSKTQFENQFYEMVRLHKENVNELKLNIPQVNLDNLPIEDKILSGRQVFRHFIYEIISLDIIISKEINSNVSKTTLHLAYSVFFDGLNKSTSKKLLNLTGNNHLSNKLLNIREKTNGKFLFRHKLSDIINKDYHIIFQHEVQHDVMNGTSSQLGHYFRHLYQTVKFVCNKDDLQISYDEKRNYLRVLRSLLSNEEQVLLFYNWYSGYGVKWEDEKHKFFTDYRMIHNINERLLWDGFDIIRLFHLLNPKPKCEQGRENDSLFEFED